jgi:hypothetical protein
MGGGGGELMISCYSVGACEIYSSSPALEPPCFGIKLLQEVFNGEPRGRALPQKNGFPH